MKLHHYRGRYLIKNDVEVLNCTENPYIIYVLEPTEDLEYVCSGKPFIISDMIYPVLDDSSIRKLYWCIS